jgi:hypothetical protein
MIRTLPVDTTRLQLLAAGPVTASAEWVELADGSRRPSGNQAKDQETGRRIWVVDCLVTGGERAEVIGVQVMGDEPQVEPLTPVEFVDLEVRVSKSRAGAIAQYWSAAGVAALAKRPSPSPAAV